MGSAASTDSANYGRESPARDQSDEEGRRGIDQENAPEVQDSPYPQPSPRPTPGLTLPSHSSRSMSIPHSDRESLAPSRKSKANSDRSRSQRSKARSRASRSISHMSIEDDPIEEDRRTASVAIPSPTLSITNDQQDMVRECLSLLEKSFVNSGVHLNVDRVLPYVETITRTDASIVDGEALLKDNGVYIVQDGLLDLCAADGHTVSQRLQTGDFFGELSTLFRVPTNGDVNVVSSEVTLLHLPADAVRECVTIDDGGKGFSKEIMLNWCVKKSYLESRELFGHGVLSHKVVSNCLKTSVLSDLSMGAIEFIARLATPMLFEPGDVIYSTGEEASYIFLVLKGGIEILKGGDVVESRNVKFSDEGYCLGHREFFSGVKFSNEIRVASPVTVASVSKEVLLEMLNKFPEEVTKLRTLLSTHKRAR